MASRGSVQDSIFSQPRTPNTPATRPSSMDAVRSTAIGNTCCVSSGCGGVAGLLDQRADLVAHLRTLVDPVLHALEIEVQRGVLAAGNRVEVTQALQRTTVALVALVGDDDVVERTLLGAATGQTDLDHDDSL